MKYCKLDHAQYEDGTRCPFCEEKIDSKSDGFLVRLINRVFNKPPKLAREAVGGIPPKDPNDLSLSATSTKWEHFYCCGNCKKPTSHEERMTNICNSCGHRGRMSNDARRRRIWNGSKWIFQHNYD